MRSVGIACGFVRDRRRVRKTYSNTVSLTALLCDYRYVLNTVSLRKPREGEREAVSDCRCSLIIVVWGFFVIFFGFF